MIAFGLFVLASCANSETKTAATADSTVVKMDSTSVAAVYQCPMKCEGEKTYPAAGQCPVCGMDLEKIN